MARVKLSEYRAKSLLVSGYSGVSLHLDTLDQDAANLDDSLRYVVKVDQGVKKRGKQGLLKLNVAANEVADCARTLSERGFTRFIAEPMNSHSDSDERYISFERTRQGIVISYSEQGGVTVEDNPDSVRHYSQDDVPVPRAWVQHVLEIMDKEHMAFVEINPLIVDGDVCTLLDAAVLVDSAGGSVATWNDDDIVETEVPYDTELAITKLNNNSTAAFTFKILNKDAPLWLLLMGGGASIVIADEAQNQGKAHTIGNFGEYSGGPTTEEVYLYTVQVLRQMFMSNAPQKAIVIAGGVANFSNVEVMFRGVIRALSESLKDIQDSKIKVYVRRGGPHEVEGLQNIEHFLKENDLYGSVHGSDAVLTDVINEALGYIEGASNA